MSERKKVFVTRKLPGSAMERLGEAFDLEWNTLDRNLTYEEFKKAARGRNGLITMLSDRVDAELMEAAEDVEIIANYAVGYNNMEVGEATRRGIQLSNTPDVLTADTADMAWALILAAARRIPEADRLTRAGLYKGWGPEFMLGRSVSGKTLGIIGAGRIGAAVARRAKGFDMRILYHNRNRNPAVEALGVGYASFMELIERADIITLHVPLNEETRHLIDRKALEAMKPDCLLINTSRGPVIDEEALVEALEKRVIAGAGLDVYEHEPALTPGLEKLDNVVLCPHLGSATHETRIRMADIAAENVISFLRGEGAVTGINEVMK